MTYLPEFKIWDGKILHNVIKLNWGKMGIEWVGEDNKKGWVFVNRHPLWDGKNKPDEDLLLEVVDI